MDIALMIARSGLEAHHKNIEVISNNLANSNTEAFKKNRAEFTDLPYQIVKQPGIPIVEGNSTTSGLVVGTGTKLSSNKKIFEQGPQIQTGNQFDVMIQGRGFLQVQLPNNNTFAYTRAGSLTINDQGQLTTQSGYLVQPPITIPPQAQISIDQSGMVNAIIPGQQAPAQIGQLQLADFLNPDGLQPIGDNLYIETNSSGVVALGNPGQDAYGLIKQGVIEGSNVNVVEEMVNLIEAQRAFEVTSKAVSAVDNMLEELNRTT
jgi:flagellar basal-body rod protein FlgG